MRWIVLLLALAAASLSTTCAGDRSPSSAIPASRSVSATGEGRTAGPLEQARHSAGATEITSYPSRWRLQCAAGGEAEWVILAAHELKPATETLRYLFVEADTAHQLSGRVFAGISDWTRGSWSFQDVSMTGWHDGWPDDYYVGLDVPAGIQPVGPTGDLYFAVVVSGPSAEASAARRLDVYWEYDAPFLAAPVLGSGKEIDPGPDWGCPQCGGLAIYHCEGPWNPAQAEIIHGWYDDWLPEWFTDDGGGQVRSYAAALRLGPDQSTPPLSEFSNVLTFGEK